MPHPVPEACITMEHNFFVLTEEILAIGDCLRICAGFSNLCFCVMRDQSIICFEADVMEFWPEVPEDEEEV
jgi:hypothetical protein